MARKRHGAAWERQEGESEQAYEAFDLYCKMGSERSMEKVRKELGKSLTLMERWSGQWNWVERAREYDNELKQKEFEETEKAVKKMRERQIQAAMLLQKKAIQALDKLNVDDLSARDILRYILEGAKLEAANRMPGVEQTGQNRDNDNSGDDVIVYLPDNGRKDGPEPPGEGDDIDG